MNVHTFCTYLKRHFELISEGKTSFYAVEVFYLHLPAFQTLINGSLVPETRLN